MKPRANLSFTGIATFCRTPYVESLDDLTSDIAVLGIPFDEGVGFRPGCRFGPRAIREYSMRFPYFDPASAERGYFDIEQEKRLLSDVRMVDCGDVDIVPLDYEYVYERIGRRSGKSSARGSFPFYSAEITPLPIRSFPPWKKSGRWTWSRSTRTSTGGIRCPAFGSATAVRYGESRNSVLSKGSSASA